MNILNMRGKLRSNGSYKDYGASSKTHIIVHHSLTKTGSAEAYARYHVDTLGWPGIGYHFVIEQDGTIKQNHSIGVMSYHVGNHNKYCVGICLTGDFRTQEPTSAQKRSLCWLVSHLQKTYPQLKTIKGHSDLKGYEWKDCPCFDYNHVLREGAGNNNSSSTVESKPIRSAGIGIAVSKYPEGYGVNLYTKPVSGFYNGRISDKTPYLILAGAWYGGDQNMICLGGQQWAEQKHFDVQWFKAYSKYPAGYGINTYSKPGAPDGSFKGQVDGAAPLDIYSRENGWIDIGNQTFVEEKHFDIK
ncbi:peptidoglycan recognition family protein [Bacillus sp. TL12]|uniref:peptidoglycan recognition protein family protein n=1 Tax=Bacillus sp. TL12 TaxID=2894756 RepID=UPI001F52114F|nr:peptidoglycan recognition family protein [Bacillus sp. TL12]MCI0767417.1 peptidoglycan recognition protein family protein [Bacillus sp. TL12]